MNTHKKELFDEQAIYFAFEKIVENKTENMEIHFVYSGSYYAFEERLRSLILKGMKKYKIRKVMVTMIHGRRSWLITKEKMENYCKGKENLKKSVNDDIEQLLENIQLGKELNETFWTYYLPKLTKEELVLVEKRDNEFMRTFSYGMDADVDKAEMILSESDSKYVMGFFRRETFTIENSYPEESIENKPHKRWQSLEHKTYFCCSLQ